jgi:hypothetical protein
LHIPIVAAGFEALAKGDYRALAGIVHEGHGGAGRSATASLKYADAERAQARRRPAAKLIGAQRSEERCATRESGQLDGRHGSAPRGVLEGVSRMNDLSCARDVPHARELDPLDVPDHRHVWPPRRHVGSLTQTRRAVSIYERLIYRRYFYRRY